MVPFYRQKHGHVVLPDAARADLSGSRVLLDLSMSHTSGPLPFSCPRTVHQFTRPITASPHPIPVTGRAGVGPGVETLSEIQNPGATPNLNRYGYL